MRALALVLLVASSLGVPAPMPAPLDSGLVWDRFENLRLGHTVRVPSGWHASIRAEDGATVITSLPVPNRYDNPERIGLPRGGVYIWIFDYGRVPGGGGPGRPDRIELGEKRMHACGFGEGYTLHFTDHGRSLHVFVKLGPMTAEHTALAVVNSLRVTE